MERESTSYDQKGRAVGNQTQQLKQRGHLSYSTSVRGLHDITSS